MSSIIKKLTYTKNAINNIELALNEKGQNVTGNTPLADYANIIRNISSGGGTTPEYTGHADVEGLTAIGWDSKDIEYFQKNGVDWNEEFDKYNKVPSENIKLYTDGIIDENLNSLYLRQRLDVHKNKIVYLPKIDTSSLKNFESVFKDLSYLVGVPIIDMSQAIIAKYIFYGCRALKCISLVNSSKVTNIMHGFGTCYNLKRISDLDLSSCLDVRNLFYQCNSLICTPNIIFNSNVNCDNLLYHCHAVTQITSIPNTIPAISLLGMFDNCYTLRYIPDLDISAVTNIGRNIFSSCLCLEFIKLKGLKCDISFHQCPRLSYDSIMYLINNAQNVSNKTITLTETNLSKLTDEEKSIATSKGWVLA